MIAAELKGTMLLLLMVLVCPLNSGELITAQHTLDIHIMNKLLCTLLNSLAVFDD